MKKDNPTDYGEIKDAVWKMFEKTGEIGYYNLFKTLSEEE